MLLIVSLISLDLTAQYDVSGLSLQGGLEEWYDSLLGVNNTSLYEGVLYELPRRSARSHQFYKNMFWATGQITFDGQRYQNVYLVYDILSDVLVVRNPHLVEFGVESLKINQYKIDQFEIYEQHFRRFRSPIVPPEGEGFYQVLFEEGPIRLVAKRRKEEKIVGTTIDFKQRDRYYFFFNDDYSPIKGKKSFYDLFPELKTRLRDYIKNHHLSIRSGNDRDLVKLTAYCYELLMP